MNEININIGDQVEYIGKIKENPFWDLSTPFYVKRVFDDEVHLVDEIGDLGCFPVSPKDIRKIAAGHRIDCEILDYPEDYTSPNCKKFDELQKRVDVVIQQSKEFIQSCKNDADIFEDKYQAKVAYGAEAVVELLEQALKGGSDD